MNQPDGDLKPFELEEEAPRPNTPVPEAARTETGNAFVRPTKAAATDAGDARDGEDEASDEAAEASTATATANADPFADTLSPETRLRQTLLTVAIVLLTGAVVLGMVFMGRADAGDGRLGDTPTWLHRAARAGTTMLSGVIHTMTGLVAVYLGAKVLGLKVGSVAGAIARMGVAVSACLLVLSVSIPVPWVGPVLKVLLAGGAYYGVVLLLFGRRVERANMLLSIHAAMAMLLAIYGGLGDVAGPYILR
ncbi:MAG: hypothetical protein MUE97_06220 [Phycisphaerales bacterium]|jgi:hypothetical protein|nr:hypothetical protein [Phycisphaerales bacterium]